MKQETLKNIKINVLEEKLKDAIKSGTLDQNMSLLRMEAAEIGLTNDDFDALISDTKKAVTINEETAKSFGKSKHLLFALTAIIIIIEWVLLPIGIGWKIALSLLTVVLVIVVVSLIIFIRKKKK